MPTAPSTRRDHYLVLGVTRQAPDAEIKASYRKLALLHHPDRNPGDAAAEDRFKEVKEAYETLSDAIRRAQYDRYGHDVPKGSSGARDISDIFTSMFRK